MAKELEPISKLNTLLSSSSFLFIVYYRGHWCPWCMSYLSTLQALSPLISSSGGKTLAVTSEPETFLDATRQKSGYIGEVIIDSENILAGYLREKGWVDVVVQESWVLESRGYSKGMAQPGVLVLRKGKDGEEVEILESWAIVPSLMNWGGGKDRPDLRQIWENVQATVEGKEIVHKNGYTQIGLLEAMKRMVWG